MKRILSLLPILLASMMVVTGCSDDDDVVIPPPPPATPPPPPPPPVADAAPAGAWIGQAMIPDIEGVTTSFEFDDSDGFVEGTSPFSVDFQGGTAETRGDPALYTDGTFAWHVAAGTDGTVTFETPASTVTFFTRLVNAGDEATITISDVNGDPIDVVAVTESFEEVTVTRDPAVGESLIGSMTVEVTTGELVIDAFSSDFAATEATDDAGCLVAPDDRFVCTFTDATTGELTAGANGTLDVAVDQVSGSGWMYAAPGDTLADGSSVSEITISAGTVAEAATLDMTIDGSGVPIELTLAYDAALFERASDLATVEASFTDFDIFGDTSTFDVDATGAISGTSAAGCLLMGQISVIDPTINVYDVTLNVTDGGAATCGVTDGDYAGLGQTQDVNAVDDAFEFAAFIDGTDWVAGGAIQ